MIYKFCVSSLFLPHIYQSNIRSVSASICHHEAWSCIPLMCDHYTNEVNGSAVLTIRWMPPSGTCPFVCVRVVGLSVLLSVFAFVVRWTKVFFFLPHNQVSTSCQSVSINISSHALSCNPIISQSYVWISLVSRIIFELYKLM